MEIIKVYPKNQKQITLLKSLLEEMKVQFEVGKYDETQMSETEFIKKIDQSIAQAESGQTHKLSKEEQKTLLGL